MGLLITFIIVWALSPGPVAVLTLHESRKNGFMAGVAISGGATLTSILMVIMAGVLYTVGFPTVPESDNTLMTLIERLGAFGIIFMGMYAGYKSLWSSNDNTNQTDSNPKTKRQWVQGMMVMATYIPQALFFYSVIIPQTVDTQSILTTIIVLGTVKVILIFGWHSIIAFIATRSQRWMGNPRFGKVLEVTTACLIMVLGLNILI